jgi:hypothetical protein
MKVIVYHIFCFGNYQDIVQSQLNRLKTSGLYEWCDIMEVSCVDTEGKYEGIDELFDGMNKVNMFKTNRNGYEYWPIKKIWDLSQEHDGQVFYFHAKGVSNTYTNLNTREPSQWKIDGINIWRDALEYHLIDNFQQCVDDLKTHDTCGMTCVGNWYWGNFWWSNLSFIKENKDPVHGDRWYFEDWLHHARHYNSKEYFHFTWNPYFSNLPIEAYTNIDFFKNKSIEVISGLFGTIGIQQDEGYPPDLPKTQIDVTEKLKQNLIYNNNQMINLRVDINVMGDPIHGQRKFLIIELNLDNEVYRICYNENFNIDLKFI